MSPWIALVAIVAVAACLVAWGLYRSETREVSPSLARALAALRCAALVATLLLLLEPTWVTRSERVRRGRIEILVDHSGSMARDDPRMDEQRRSRLRERLPVTERSTRWERAQALCLDRSAGLLAALVPTRDVSISLFAGETERFLTTADRPDPNALPSSFGRDADGRVTDLAGAIRTAASRDPEAIVIVTDGRHNAPGEPEAETAPLRARGVPVHAIGVGSSFEPVDIAIVEVRAPRRVDVEEGGRATAELRARVETTTTLRASLRAVGEGVVDRALWSGQVTVEAGSEPRVIELPMVIPGGALEAGRRELELWIEPSAEEVTSTNNGRRFLVDVGRRTLRVLLLDGRPRWEFRYLKNILERDEGVDGTVVLGGVSVERGELPRGDERDELPATREAMLRRDVVILGDLPRSLLRDDEIAAIRELVSDRGGALVLIAGRHEHLREYVDSPIAELLPVALPGPARDETAADLTLNLTQAGRLRPELRLADVDATANAAMWRLLPPPARVQRARALPGSETLVETATAEPVLVTRRFGAGTVVYLGIDETWRWRYRSGDVYHGRFWGQLLDSLRQDTFAVSDGVLALDTDRTTYAPGERATIRVRFAGDAADANARVVAILETDGGTARPVTLEEEGDALVGVTSPLEPGRHRVVARLERPGAPATTLALPIAVEAPPSPELLALSWNEPLLRRIADLTGGRFVREESFTELVDALASPADRVVEERRIDLTRSAWWFAVIAALLTIEWMLRKRSGLL